MHEVDEKKWRVFSKSEQLQNIAVEIGRASHAMLHEEEGNKDWILEAYERAIDLLDASILDPKWEDKKMLYGLRDAVAALYVGDMSPVISNFISRQLLEKDAS